MKKFVLLAVMGLSLMSCNSNSGKVLELCGGKGGGEYCSNVARYEDKYYLDEKYSFIGQANHHNHTHLFFLIR